MQHSHPVDSANTMDHRASPRQNAMCAILDGPKWEIYDCQLHLQLRMLEDALDFNGDPGIVVLLTGDGAGYNEGTGFHSTLERMHRRGWRIEILSWAHSTNQSRRATIAASQLPIDQWHTHSAIQPSPTPYWTG